MDWHELDKVSLQSSTERLLDDVRRGLDEVNRLRPLHPNLVESVTAVLLADRVYNSNAVEGNPLDLRETRRILEAGHQLTTEKRSRSELEVINLAAAVAFFETQLIPSERPHQAANLLALHAILMKDVDEDAGRFRHKDVMLRGAKYQPPDPSQVEELVERALGELGSRGASVDPVVAATWIHWAIARAHPFFDGNGRTARLWQDLVLLRAQAACAIIRPEERTRYYQALQTADEGRFDPLVLLVAERVAWTIDRIRLAAAARDRMKDWATRLVSQLGAPTIETLNAEFIRWSRHLNLLINGLKECAAALSAVAPDVRVVVQQCEPLDETAWQNLRWKWIPTDPRVVEITVFLKGDLRGEFALRYGNWFVATEEGPDKEMGDCAELQLTVPSRQWGTLEKAWIDEAVIRDGVENRRTLSGLVSSNGIHVLETRMSTVEQSPDDSPWGSDSPLRSSLERFVDPLVAAQRILEFAVDAARSKREDGSLP